MSGWIDLPKAIVSNKEFTFTFTFNVQMNHLKLFIKCRCWFRGSRFGFEISNMTSGNVLIPVVSFSWGEGCSPYRIDCSPIRICNRSLGFKFLWNHERRGKCMSSAIKLDFLFYIWNAVSISPWRNHLNSQSLSFFICKVGVLVELSYTADIEIKWEKSM